MKTGSNGSGQEVFERRKVKKFQILIKSGGSFRTRRLDSLKKTKKPRFSTTSIMLKVLVSYISVLHNFGFGKVSPAKQL